VNNNVPQGLVIWLPGDGNFHMIGISNTTGKWLGSGWVIRPEKELNGFLDVARQDGSVVLNMRNKASKINPGMEKAVPILVASKGVPLKLIAEGYAVFARAIIDSEDK
jgi:hypothetical protein